MDKEKKFVIGIPTRERSSLVEEKVDNFLFWVKKNKFEFFDSIVVADNSFKANKKLIKLSENNFIKYLHSGKNEGFGGNIRRLCNSSKGKYLWIVGDDDFIDEDSFIAVNKYFHNKNISKYITFSSVSNFELARSNSINKKNDHEDFKRIKSENFILNDWRSVIFVSANIIYVPLNNDVLYKDREISDVFENSVISFSIIGKSKFVDIINSTSPIDSFTEKLYSPYERFQVSLIQFIDVIDALLKISKSKNLRKDLTDDYYSKLKTAIIYALFYEFNLSNSNLNNSLTRLISRLKISKFKEKSKLYELKILKILVFILIPIVRVLSKFLSRNAKKSLFSLFIDKDYYEKKLKFIHKVFNSKGMGYIKN